MATDCTQDIVGVTNSTLIPFYDELTPEVQEAIIANTSGLFMDKLPGGVDLMTVDDVDYMNALLTFALDAKGEAAKILKDELLIAINNRYATSKTKFNGEIGRRSTSNNLNSTGDNQGQRYRMTEPIAGSIKINKVAVNLSGARTFNVYIAGNATGEYQMGEILYALPVTSSGGVWVNCDISAYPEGIILPMHVNGEAQEYYIFFKRSEAGNLFPKNNDIKCATCDHSHSTLSQYMEYHGFAAADMGNLRNVKADAYGHGLSVTALVGCENQSIICREYEKQEAVSLMMQWAALYKAGELWIEYVQKSGIVNKTNLQNREYLWGKRNHFRKEFDERITSIANTMELGETNCYTCKSDKIIKGLIRA